MEKLDETILRERTAERRVADDNVIQRRSQRGRIKRSFKVDDVGFIERAIRVVTHLHGMEDLALGLGGW
jgi:hypothetical protein